MEPTWIEYPYARWNPINGNVDYRPFASVEFIGVKDSVTLPGLIDSGAEDSILHIDLAETLGLI